MCETGPKPAPSYTDLEQRLSASESARREAEKARDDHFAVRLLAETERDRLRERLDQFDAHGFPNVAAALDRVNAAESRVARLEAALREIDQKIGHFAEMTVEDFPLALIPLVAKITHAALAAEKSAHEETRRERDDNADVIMEQNHAWADRCEAAESRLAELEKTIEILQDAIEIGEANDKKLAAAEECLREIAECVCQRNWYTAGKSLDCLAIATVVPCASCIARAFPVGGKP